MRKPRNESRIFARIRRFFLSHPLLPYKATSGKYLTKDATRVLVSCIYDVDDSFYNGDVITASNLESYLGKGKSFSPMSRTDLYYAVFYLQSLGLASHLSGTSENFSFRSTYEAYCFLELRRMHFRYWLANSVLLPILISIVTTLLIISFNV